MRKMYFILFLLFILSCLAANAQLDANKLMQFDELKGTPVRDILPDREGNIWIATQSGLVKFDGYKFTRFHPDLTDSTTMGELLTYSLFEDRNGYIWIGSQDAVYRYNPADRTFKRFTYRHLLEVRDGYLSSVSCMAENNRGRIYFGAYTQIVDPENEYRSKGLFYYDEDKETMEAYALPEGVDLYSVDYLSADANDNIWLFGNSGFYKLDTLNHLVNIPCPEGQFCLKENEYITGMAIDSSGRIWFSSNLSNIRWYDPATKHIELVDLDFPFSGNLFNPFTEFLIDKKQHLWFATQQGLVRYDPVKKVTEAFDPGSRDRLLRNMATALATDYFGNLWIGTESMGLLKYNPRNLLSSFVWDDNDPSTISTGWVFRIFEDEQGEVWIGTRGAGENAGISRLDLENKVAHPYFFKDIFPGERLYDLYAGISPGKMFFASDKGAKLLDYKNMAVKDTTMALLNDTIPVNNMIKDSRGNVWYCSYWGLYKQHVQTGRIEHFDLMELPFSGINSNSVTNLYESPQHGLWIITDDGLFLYDYQSGKISRHGMNPERGRSFPVQDINSLYASSDGILWVGTWQGGLCRYNPATGDIKTYTTNDGLPSMSIQGILGDEKNNALWLSTFVGISRFSLDNEQFNNFSLRDGIQGLLYADGQYLKTSSGYFLFGGNNGVTYFRPDDIAENAQPPITYITRFNVGDKSYNLGQDYPDKKSFNLAHDENNISIDFTGIQYDDPVKNKFAFMLQNFDKAWREVGNQQSAYYYNLPPGSYTFQVKAANSHGVWNKEPVSMSFVIKPPWWQTWWAFGIYAVIFFGFIISYDRWRKNRLLEKERQLTREKELAHAREIEKAYKELKSTQNQLIHAEKMASLGELTAGIAHEIQNPLNFVNNFSEVSAELIDEVSEELVKTRHALSLVDANPLNEAEAILTDIKQNLEKITHHGRRADAIVKGMLAHSRSGKGEKELTDINQLADEFLRLSYHGLRAKNKDFNAEFKTDFDANLPKVNVVSQDIGRVLLNLINNAFQAVGTGHAPSQQPMVTVSTRNLGDKIEISVKDNGPGIPEEIKNKIFQPFFTTKPTGQGTGLGLSLSYDIVKAHGGELNVEMLEGEGLPAGEAGTEFIIQLPNS
jgi:signal transduction histidine kinase/ligand-binding sensor domain-containing protein